MNGSGRRVSKEVLEQPTAVVLAAGGPTAPLIAGALYAFYEAGVRFPRIYTAGGGALVGLMLVAPRVDNPRVFRRGEKYGQKYRLEALKKMPEALGVAAQIYDWLPVNYKTFFKPGPFTALIRRWSSLLKVPPPKSTRPERNKKSRLLYNDWIDFAASAITPASYSRTSEGLCPPFPFIDELVDFKVLDKWNGKIYMPAYVLTKDPGRAGIHNVNPRLVQFTNNPGRGEKKLKGADEFRACLAAPFIYPPVKIGTNLYTEGAFHDPKNVDAWAKDMESGKIKNVLIMDTLGTVEMEKILLRKPRDLWDAYGLSIITPAVAMARAQQRRIENRLKDVREALVKSAEKEKLGSGRELPKKLHRTIQWRVPKKLHANIMDWSYTNLSALFEHGRKVGERYLKKESSRFAHLKEIHKRARLQNCDILCGQQVFAEVKGEYRNPVA